MALELIINKIRLMHHQGKISAELYEEIYRLVRKAYEMGMKHAFDYKPAKNKKRIDGDEDL